MEDERRLVGRVLRHWTEMVHEGRFPRLDEIDPWMLGEDWENCLLIASALNPSRLSDFSLPRLVSRQWAIARGA